MNSDMKAPVRSVFDLSPAEKLQLVEDLWDSIAAEDANEPVSDEKILELRRRKEHYRNHPNSGRTWEEVKSRARAK